MTQKPLLVTIRYRRIPDRLQVFEQWVLEEGDEYVVTFLEAAAIPSPLAPEGTTILEPGSPIIWFTYPGAWYDVGRFHLRDGTFTGFYANVLTPVRIEAGIWETTDLCLDVWSGADGRVLILDHEEFTEAVSRGWIDPLTAATARETVRKLADAARAGTWPPPHVHEWTLDRARRRMAELRIP